MKNTANRDKETNREYALRVIRENIVKLELAPGSMISEQDIANELNLQEHQFTRLCRSFLQQR